MEEKVSHKRRNVILAVVVGSMLICCIGFFVCWGADYLVAPTYKATTIAKVRATETVRLRNTPPSPTLVSPGLTYHNPAPLGGAVVADNDIEITVLNVMRGAWSEVQQANRGDLLRKGYQYVLIQAQAKNLGPADKIKEIGTSDFHVTGSRGVIYGYGFHRSCAGKPFRGEFFGGGTIEGELVFEVPEDETNLILIYDPGVESTSRWLALEELTFPIVPPIEPAPGAGERGRKKGAPAPLGEAVLSDGGLELTVLDVQWEAWQQVDDITQQPLDPPKEGMECILAKVQIRYIEGQKQTLTISPLSFGVTGDERVIYEPLYHFWIVDRRIIDPLFVEFFEGGAFAGQLVLQAVQGEQGLILIYDPGSGSAARYLSLEQ